MNGTHRPEGILLAVGEGADALCADSGPRLEDVAPTMLSLLGLPRPEEMTGRDLRETN